MNTDVSSKIALKSQPYYFGVYANIARHNVFNVLNHIAEKTGLGKHGGEDKMWEAMVIKVLNPDFKAGKKSNFSVPDIQRRVIEYLHLYFPFLKALNLKLDAANQDPTRYYELLKLFLTLLEQTRNQYNHAIAEPAVFTERLIELLNIIFDDGLLVIKERFQLQEVQIKHLRRYDGMDRVTRKPKVNSNFYYKFSDNTGSITEKGLAFFICLFLDKEYGYLFLKKLSGFKKGTTRTGSESISYGASLETYCVYGIRLPQTKLSSSGNYSTALLLDMLNELPRCPKELYDTLSPDNKQAFIKTIITPGDADNDVFAGDEENTAILQRKQNRFPYFALRYIDTMQLFTMLRFQVDLGNYHFKSYPKQMDSENIIRQWEKKLLSFGRLDDYAEPPVEWQPLIKDPATIDKTTATPFLVQTTPHYHFAEKNIGLKNVNKQDVRYKLWPLLENEKKPVTAEPDFYLCTDELSGLMFYDYLARLYNARTAELVIIGFGEKVDQFLRAVNEGDKVKPISKNKITNENSAASIADLLKGDDFEKEYKLRKDWLATELKNYGLEPHQVPDTLCRYLMQIEPVSFKERARFAVNYMLKDTQSLLKKTISKPKKDQIKEIERKKQRSLHLKAGDSALFLAKDMVFMQPPLKDEFGSATPKGKANPDEFQLLQSRLAFFGRDKKLLPQTFRLCGLIDSNNPHPFLHKIALDQCKDNLAFYKSYLEEREAFLNERLEKDDCINYHFLLSGAIEETTDDVYFRQLAETIRTKPTNLPRGLFKDSIVELLRNNGNSIMKELVKDPDTKHNVVYLVNEWYKQHGDGYQTFYDHKRNYRTVDELYDTRVGSTPSKPLTKLYKSAEELSHLAVDLKKSKRKRKNGDSLFYPLYAKKVIENEKLIRHYRAADQVLFLLCRELVKKVEPSVQTALEGEFLLLDISPDNDKSILGKQVDFTIPVTTIDKQVIKITSTFKIKNYGDFRKYVKDRRLPYLLPYFKKDTVTKDELERQLKLYEQARLALFKEVYAFECACRDNPLFQEFIGEKLNMLDKNGNKLNYVDHWSLLSKYAEISGTDLTLLRELKVIRNRFSHNEFPELAIVANIIKGEKPFIEELANWATAMYQEFTKKLTTELNANEILKS